MCISREIGDLVLVDQFGNRRVHQASFRRGIADARSDFGLVAEVERRSTADGSRVSTARPRNAGTPSVLRMAGEGHTGSRLVLW
jgi:hypothetical protein